MTSKAVNVKMPAFGRRGVTVATIGLCSFLASCATVKLEAPDKPIEINLNINITQELRVKLDKDIEDLISENPDIF